jgi:response regulator RpfG family c-di-GMP phosphodiesterase
LERFLTSWEALESQLSIVNTQLRKMEHDNNPYWNRALLDLTLDQSDLYSKYMIKDTREEISNLNSLISEVFQNQLEKLYYELSNSNKRQYKIIDLTNLVTILVTSIIMNIILLLVLTSILHKQDILNKQSEDTMEATILALAHQAEIRDNDTGRHIERTAIYVELLAKELRKRHKFSAYITDEYITALKKSAPLHDIGKVGIRDEILNKPGKLTVDEFDVMKKHAIHGAETLKIASHKLSFNSYLTIAIRLTRHHHEKWNGQGYPDGLAGEEIPISARIMAVADVYDALRSKRVYKPAYSHSKSREIIISESGKYFDPDLVECFLKIEDQIKEISIRFQDY